jgi:hypothetical protein
MDNFLIDTVIEKVAGHEKRLDKNEMMLTELEENVSGMSDQSDNLNNLADLVGRIQERMNKIVWPVEKINELTLKLKLNNDLLSNPVKTKQSVFHTAGKLAWVILCLFIAVVSLIIGLFETARKLDRYKTNDLLWRYVKVVNKDQNLEYLQWVEKLNLKDPEKMKSIVITAELYQKQLIEAETNNGAQVSIDSITSSKKIKSKLKRIR